MNKNRNTPDNLSETHRKLYDYMCTTEPYATEIKSNKAKRIPYAMKIVNKAMSNYVENVNANYYEELLKTPPYGTTQCIRRIAHIISHVATSEIE